MKYEITVGLEVHIQLKTKSKIFCPCSNQAGAEPNTQICPICLGYPGALPQLNREAIRLAAMAGMLLECDVQHFSRFDRKSYFYPDVSKNYQISQLFHPICLGGKLEIEAAGGKRSIGITRIHIEEDVAKSVHHAGWSGVDFNRCGTPLIELVSEPEIRTAAEALAFLHALRQIMVYADIGDCNLELGNMRCDANISLRLPGATQLGSKVEIKNLNTFKGVQAALEYEAERQAELLDRGEKIKQATRRWDGDRGVTEEMRSKEDSVDYRYCWDPDLPPLIVTEEELEAWRALLPELPAARRQRLMSEYGIPAYDAEVLTAERDIADFYEATARACGNGKAASNWIMTDVLRLLSNSSKGIGEAALSAEALAELIKMVANGTVNQSIAKELLEEIFLQGGDPAKMVAERGLTQVGDADAIAAWVDQVIAAHPGPVADFLAGKKAASGFLVGQAMKLSGGKADPRQIASLVAARLAQR